MFIRKAPWRPLVVYKSTVPHPSVSTSDVEIALFKNSYLNGIPVDDPDRLNAEAFLAKNEITVKKVQDATIHAEASLMGLGCDLQKGNSYNEDIKEVFNVCHVRPCICDRF